MPDEQAGTRMVLAEPVDDLAEILAVGGERRVREVPLRAAEAGEVMCEPAQV